MIRLRKGLALGLAALMALIMLMPVGALAAIDVVQPTEQFYVGDFADVFDAGVETHIAQYGAALYDATDVDLVIAAVNFIGDNTIDAYARAMYEQWGINGLLVLMVIGSEDWAYRVGDDIAERLPVSTVGQMMNDYLEPYFAEQRYSDGALAIFDAFYDKIAEIYGAPQLDGTIAGAQAVQPVTNTAVNRTSSSFSIGSIFSAVGRFIGSIFSFIGGIIAMPFIILLVIILIVVGGIAGGFRHRGVWRRPPMGPGPGGMPGPGPGPANKPFRTNNPGARPFNQGTPTSRPSGGSTPFRSTSSRPSSGSSFGGSRSGGSFGSSRPSNGGFGSSRPSGGSSFGGSRSSGGSRPSGGSHSGGGGSTRGGGAGRGR